MYAKIVKQLENDFSRFPVQFLRNELEDLARKVEKEFEEMVGKPNKIYVNPKNTIFVPKVILNREEDETTMLERMPNQKERSDLGIEVKKLQYENIVIYMIPDHNFRIVGLYFVLPFTEEEKQAEKEIEAKVRKEVDERSWSNYFVKQLQVLESRLKEDRE